jgi:hypothetical protein
MTFKPTKNPSYYKLFLYSTFQNLGAILGKTILLTYSQLINTFPRCTITYLFHEFSDHNNNNNNKNNNDDDRTDSY